MIPKKLNIKSTRDFEEKIYNINKIVWHADKLCELHHARGRNGVRLCCPALWAQGGPMHHTNRTWIKQMKEAYRPVEREVLKNYIKGIGCREQIYKTCEICAMPEASTGPIGIQVAVDQSDQDKAPGAIVETNSEAKNADNQ